MSSSFGAVYARVPAGAAPALEAALKSVGSPKYPAFPGILAFDPAQHDFAIVDRWGNQDNMPGWSECFDLSSVPDLARLSSAVGEVIAFYEIDDGLTQGIYGAWKDGAIVRELQWMDMQWLKAQGDPQPWEASFFCDAALKRAIEPADEADKADISAAYAAKLIETGARWPLPFFNITRTCRAPEFFFQPWPRRSELMSQRRGK